MKPPHSLIPIAQITKMVKKEHVWLRASVSLTAKKAIMKV